MIDMDEEERIKVESEPPLPDQKYIKLFKIDAKLEE